MKIATLNIDWGKKYNSKNHYKRIEKYLHLQNFDFLIITEGIDLDLQNFKYKYFADRIPENCLYEGLNYSKYLNGEKVARTIIYSQTPFVKKYQVSDNKTSIALEYATEVGNCVIYATIIGTWFKKQPYAQIELENCIKDCQEIYRQNKNIFIVGDLNTSFKKNEKNLQINSETTVKLEKLFENLDLFNATASIKQNIDHIIIPKSLKKYLIESDEFVEKDVLSDHKGVFINLELNCKL